MLGLRSFSYILLSSSGVPDEIIAGSVAGGLTVLILIGLLLLAVILKRWEIIILSLFYARLFFFLFLPGSASSPCFSPSSDWAGDVGTPDSEDSTSPFFCRKSVHYCSNCFHRITVWYWDFSPHIQWLRDCPGSRFSGDLFPRKIKKYLTPDKGDIGATMNIFISVTPDTRCSLTCFHGHLLHAVVISPPHPFTKLRGFSRFRQSLWRAFKIKRRKKNWKKIDVSLTRGTIRVTPSVLYPYLPRPGGKFWVRDQVTLVLNAPHSHSSAQITNVLFWLILFYWRDGLCCKGGTARSLPPFPK